MRHVRRGGRERFVRVARRIGVAAYRRIGVAGLRASAGPLQFGSDEPLSRLFRSQTGAARSEALGKHKQKG
jgi:hypothetical protein